jgi:hypothetical protein
VVEKKFVHGRKFGAELCEALGLDSDTVVSLSLHADVHEAACVKVTMLVAQDKADAVRGLVHRYKLQERDGG